MKTKSIIVAAIALACVYVCNLERATAQLAPEPRVRLNGRNVQIVQQQISRGAELRTDSGASLKTDPELEAILEKAERFKDEGQFWIASKLWQSVLDRSGDALFSYDEQIYFSLAQKVEQILSQLPADSGLSVYRVTADASAKEIMAEAEGPYDERALKQIVRRFFLSTLGDDTALTLSSVYMDKFDFVGAYRMLEKIITSYPDPDVSMVDVHTRMAVCQAMMGEQNNAFAALEKAKVLGDRNNSNDIVAVENSISAIAGQKSAGSAKEGYALALANRNRTGLMPSLPSRYLSTDLHAVWQYFYDPNASWADMQRFKPIFGDDVLNRAADSVTQKESSLIENWKKRGWRPAGELLFDGEQVFFKTSIDLSVWNRAADSDEVVWRPLWRNRYQIDEYTKSMIEFNRRMRRGRQRGKDPNKIELQLFNDRIASQMSIQNGVLYSIEGEHFDIAESSQIDRNNRRYNIQTRRSRTNHLTAYDVATGRLLWTLPPQEYSLTAVDPTDVNLDPFADNKSNVNVVDINDGSEDRPWVQSGGFMSAPIFYGGLVIVPVNHSGVISVYALDPELDGKTVWKSYLCDESETGANPNSPINLSVDGSDLFASCGLGVVFIIDPSTGLIRFAKRYTRTGEAQFQPGRWGRNFQQMKYESWLSDTVIAFGRQMVRFSSDSNNIEALDRNTGELIWRGEVHPLESKVDYLLGIYDGILYAAGPETILAFNLEEEGRMVWGGNQLFEGKTSYGRGMLTSSGIYMPIDNQIVKFSLSGKDGSPVRLGSADVNLGTGAPVGNLFSDGRKIWVQGANRVYALGPVNKTQSHQNAD